MMLRPSLAGLRPAPAPATVAGCRPLGGRQKAAGAGAAEPEKRAPAAPRVSVREEKEGRENRLR